MQKSIFIGASAGVLVLVFAGGWLLGGANNASTPAVTPAADIAIKKPVPMVEMPGSTQPGAVASTQDLASGSAVSAGTGMSTKERRAKLAEVRKRLAALSAQGANASPAEVSAVITELEMLTAGDLDSRYFQSLRILMENTGKIQALNREAQVILSSTDPKDLARQQFIREELTRLSAVISAEAAKMQSYARRSTASGAKP